MSSGSGTGTPVIPFIPVATSPQALTYSDMVNILARHVHRINDKDIVQMCGLSEGTNSATLKTTNLIYYFLYNQQLSKTATDNISMTACTIQTEATFCYYLVSLNYAGVVTVTKGTANGYAIPSTPIGNVPIGCFKVVTDGTHTFTSGTTDLSTTGITATFYDIDCGMAGYLINTAMRNIERKYDFSGMYARYTCALAAGTSTFDNPITNYKKIADCYAYSTGGTLYQIAKNDINTVEQKYSPGQTGYPTDIALVPQNEASLAQDQVPNLQIMVRPVPDIDYTVVITAYQYSPALDGIIYNTNWWTINHPDILLYGALCEASPYLRDMEEIPVWKSLFKEKIDTLLEAERDEQYSGSLVTLSTDNVY